MSSPIIKRTTASDADFKILINQLDYELWEELNEDQTTYEPFNKVPEINTAVVVYINDKPVACGCYKPYNNFTIEIKRMYVDKLHRGKKLSKLVLRELETWAMENKFIYAILETSIHFANARNLYQTSGYFTIPNYPPYHNLKESICMRKKMIH